MKAMNLRGLLASSALVLGAVPAFAQTEIQWWHAMTGANNDVVVKLAEEFNAAQKDYKVVPTYKGSYADNMNAGIAAFRAALVCTCVDCTYRGALWHAARRAPALLLHVKGHRLR